MTKTPAQRDAHDDILRFLVGSVVGTNSRCEVRGNGPLCTEEELWFLVQAMKASLEHRKLPPPDIDRIFALFVRAGESRHIDLREARVLCERLKGGSQESSPTPAAGRSR